MSTLKEPKKFSKLERETLEQQQQQQQQQQQLDTEIEHWSICG